MSIFAHFLLTLAAMIPAFIVFSFVLNLNEEFYYSLFMAGISILLLFLTNYIIKHIQKNGERLSIKINSAKMDNSSNIDYCLFYLSPLLTFNGNYVAIKPLAVIMIIFTIVKTASNDCSFNPILRLLGWHFYTVESDKISHLIMTRKPIRDTKKSIEIVRLTEYVFLRIT